MYGKCEVENCDTWPRYGKICDKHRYRMKTFGSYDLPPKEEKTCRAPNCNRPVDKAQNSLLCVMHRVRWGRHKSFDLPDKMPEGKVKFCRQHGYLSKEECLKRSCDKWYICIQCNRRRNNERYSKNKGKWANQKKNYIFIGKSKFKIHKDEYKKILDKQNGVCAICLKQEKIKGRKNLAVDHCHTAAKQGILKVRGLLCYDCNTSLGKFSDSIQILESAINYLRNNS